MVLLGCSLGAVSAAAILAPHKLPLGRSQDGRPIVELDDRHADDRREHRVLPPEQELGGQEEDEGQRDAATAPGLAGKGGRRS